MRILNWNTRWIGPRSRQDRFAKARALIARYDPDVICLTEARPETMPSGGQTVTSEISGAGNIENRGGRKVVLWSRFGWRDIDTLGAPGLPEGRFVSATTVVDDREWTFVGMCVPYFGYRIKEKYWGKEALRPWQGLKTYLNVLRHHILPHERYARSTILLGDYNLHIRPGKSSRQSRAVTQDCLATFSGWTIPTAGEIDDPALDKRFIDHIALTSDIHVRSMQFFSRFATDGTELSDHNGVCIEVAPV